MIKRSNPPVDPADPSEENTHARRAEQMVAIVDHCVAAKALAEEADHRFLAYLLAMTIQEAQTALRPNDDLVSRLLVEAGHDS